MSYAKFGTVTYPSKIIKILLLEGKGKDRKRDFLIIPIYRTPPI